MRQNRYVSIFEKDCGRRQLRTCGFIGENISQINMEVIGDILTGKNIDSNENTGLQIYPKRR